MKFMKYTFLWLDISFKINHIDGKTSYSFICAMPSLLIGEPYIYNIYNIHNIYNIYEHLFIASLITIKM